MTGFPGVSISAPTTLSNALKGVGFMVSVAPNPAAYRGLTIEVALSYDGGVTFGNFQSVRVGQDTSRLFNREAHPSFSTQTAQRTSIT